jgi:SsrA-binding protein
MAAYAENRKARFDFDLLSTVEAGLVLSGHEVKSIRSGRVKLDGGYVVVRGGEAYLVGVTIPPYQAANTPKDYDPERPRKLLLTQKELAELDAASEREGLTIVPIKLYNNKQKLKLEIAIARGKKKFDKRETIKKRDTKRDIERILKHQ